MDDDEGRGHAVKERAVARPDEAQGQMIRRPDRRLEVDVGAGSGA